MMIIVSKQYLLPESIWSWFWSGFLTTLLTCSCPKSICSGSCTSPLRDTLEQSTNASLLGMGDAILASSSWQTTLEGPELPFNLAGDSHFGVLFLILRLFLLGMLTFEFLMSKHDSNSSWIQINTHTRVQWLTKERNQKVGNSIPGQYVTQTWDAWCLSPLWKANSKHSSTLLDGNLTKNQQGIS